MTTIGTLLSGGECVGVGARAAGLTHLWGFEIENDIAQVARDNGFDVVTADVMQLDPHALEVPDVLHASPVCKRASQANQSAELNEDGTKEALEDTAMGEKIASFIDVMQPRVFTLENVFAYRNFKAFKIICNALERGGYMWDFDSLNAADYGVPQTRRRLILRAIRGALLPNLPQPKKWVGWYSAIEDLIPTLPDSQFAPWQLARLPEGLFETSLVERHGAFNLHEEREITTARANEPVWTVRASQRATEMATAFIVDQNYGNSNTSEDRVLSIRQSDGPMVTITAGGPKREYRAFIVDGQNAGREHGLTVLTPDEPMLTLGAANKGTYKAYLVGGGNTQLAQVDCKARHDLEPSFTVFTGDNHIPRAWLSQGRVVSMTPRALSRFQSIPDSYTLPESKKLACAIIGNAVPPLLYQKIIEPLVAGI